jgi:hypothetical protein
MSLRWIHDVFGNSVAIATFDERAPRRPGVPVHGTYLGSADAFVGMEVSINAVSVEAIIEA